MSTVSIFIASTEMSLSPWATRVPGRTATCQTLAVNDARTGVARSGSATGSASVVTAGPGVGPVELAGGPPAFLLRRRTRPPAGT